MNSSVNQLQLDITINHQLIVDVIAGPDCSSEELEVNYFEGIVEEDENWEDAEDPHFVLVTQMLVSALRRKHQSKCSSCTTKTTMLLLPAMILIPFGYLSPTFNYAMSQASSINATYDSNHVHLRQSIQLHLDGFRD